MSYIKKIFSRNLRHESTPEEIKVWNVLRNRKFFKYKFRRQHVIEGFVVDFYCHELRIALEIDGKIHEKQKEYDELRQKIIEERGINFVRVTNKEINTDIQILLSKTIRS
jgi:very-short-patch-repair endonuclease